MCASSIVYSDIIYLEEKTGNYGKGRYFFFENSFYCVKPYSNCGFRIENREVAVFAYKTVNQKIQLTNVDKKIKSSTFALK